MTQPRVAETNQTITGHAYVEAFDRLQAELQENGWLETDDLLRNSITTGCVLEVGSGPGYLGIDWLVRTSNTRLVGLDISPDMVAIAGKHTREFGLADRAVHLLGSADAIPFEDSAFEAVFTSRSLHEWLNPYRVFAELWRVLKPGGKLYVSDLRRDLSHKACSFLNQRINSDLIRETLRASIGAAYTMNDITALLAKAEFDECKVVETLFGLQVAGVKPV
jgi:ubiquinone/menaquinone biosynthesis C-methylase UbiE